MNFADFILAHDADDPAALALARGRYADCPWFGLALRTLEARRKMRGKLPEWLAVPSLHFPLPLSAEQCSSSETAGYKAAMLLEWSPGQRSIADLTGGLGVDAWAFAKAGAKVLYNDMKLELVEAARWNFGELGVEGLEFRCGEVKPGAVGEILGDFRPDAFFLDPARRDAAGGKVFRIADCSPDITALLPELFRYARYVLVKLSPMLDITLGARELGASVKEIHVVGSGGECKELLFLLDREFEGEYSVTVYDGGSTFCFSPVMEREAVPVYNDYGAWLFEPGKALMKAGCYKLLSEQFGLGKIGVNTHLYTASEPVEDLKPFGKWFRIMECAPLDKRSIKDFGSRYPYADVTARDVHMSSEELRKRLGCNSGGNVHIFALGTSSGSLLFACSRS